MHEINWSPGFSIHAVVTREARSREQSCTCPREGGGYQVHCKGAEKEARIPVKAEGTLTDAACGEADG